MRRKTILLVAVFVICFFVNGIRASEITLVKGGKAQAVIVVGKEASELEVYAASELSRYIKEMSGAIIEVLDEEDENVKQYSDIILLGRPGSGAVLDRLCRKNSIKLSEDYPGYDGFIIKTLSDEGKNYLVIGSVLSRGCLYGVYHLLEKYLHVGYFWDGDNIPRSKTITFQDIDIAERPYFPDREYMQGCAYSYSAQFWRFEDWKQDLDWMAKKKLNLLQLTLGQSIPMYNTMKELGVEADPPTAWDKYEMKLIKKISAYARRLGIRIVAPAFGGGFSIGLPADFKAKFPDSKYLEVKWLDLPARLSLYPDDPMFVRVGALFLKEYIKTFGTDHIYNMDPYPETDPGETPEAKLKVKVDFAKAMAESIKAADPTGKWFCSGWAFYSTEEWEWSNWKKSNVKAFLAAIPDDMFLVNDIWAEKNPIYKRLNYFFGKKWGFSVLHSMGGWTTIHGDLADLIKRVKDVVNDPKAKNCVNFYINPEIVHHNYVYFDLAAELAWKPQDITLDEFMEDYVVRRYGKESAPKMRLVWNELIESVYGNYDYTEPRYQKMLTLDVPGSLKKRLDYIPHLQKALSLALDERKGLADNQLYKIDIIDITRQYVAEIFNLHLTKLIEAFKSKDKDNFEREAKALRLCMDCQEKILSSDKVFYLETEMEKARKLPKHTRDSWARPAKNNPEVIRQRYTALVGMKYYPTLIDYACKDMYELVKFYYRKRVDIYIDYLRANLNNPESFSMEELDRKYRDVAETFINTPFEKYTAEPSPYLGHTIKAAQEVLDEISQTLRIH